MKDTLIVGLGNVGVGYDVADTSVATTLTHAKAFHEHKNFELVGGVDPLAMHRDRFSDHYYRPCFTDLKSAIIATDPAVVVVATPTEKHLESVREIFAFGRPLALLCEKPLAYDFQDAQQIVELCEKNNCSLYINFFRRAEPGLLSISKLLDKFDHPKSFQGVVWYSKGIFNSGSHFIDLLCFLFGDVQNVKVIKPGCTSLDPEPDVKLCFSGGDIYLLAAGVKNFFHNSLELITPNGRLRYDDGGSLIYWQDAKEDSKIPKKYRLSNDYKYLENDLFRCQAYVVELLSQALRQQRSTLCNGRDALKTSKILQEIKENL